MKLLIKTLIDGSTSQPQFKIYFSGRNFESVDKIDTKNLKYMLSKEKVGMIVYDKAEAIHIER